MPCSCKLKSSDVKYVPPKSLQVKLAEVKQVQPAKAAQPYDFSATTKPSQLCLNCVSKHLGLAYLFLRQQLPYKLVSIGQLMCASQHLYNMQLPEANYMHSLALKLLRDPENKEVQSRIEKVLQDLYETSQLPGIQQREEGTPLQEYLLTLLLVYSLVFTQIMYQKSNIPWAVSHLAQASIFYFEASRNREQFQSTREIWKLLQDIKDFNKEYSSAKSRLWNFIEQLYNEYKKQKQQKESIISL